MVLFFEFGRLGNQLFQYHAFRRFDPHGRILAVGMDDLKNGFDGVDLRDAGVWCKFLVSLMSLLGQKRVMFLARNLRLLGLVREVRSAQGVDFTVSTGLLAGVFYFAPASYQSDGMVLPSLADSIRPGEVSRLKARQFVAALPCEQRHCYFVHVRRRDYTSWPSAAPAALPLDWYKARMEQVLDADPEGHFIVVSDDHDYVDRFLATETRVIVHRGDVLADFCVMAECLGGGIMSASTFSWWAGYYVRRANSDAALYAPMYWVGHPTGAWYPPGLRSPWIDYVEVVCQVDSAGAQER